MVKTVLVAIVTRGRPDELARVLDVLVEQVLENRLVNASIAVVDNDPDGTARAVVAATACGPAAHRIAYMQQRVPGIAAARNTALDAARGYDAVVFVDDDDVPVPAWFEELVGLWLQSGSAGVSGPLRSVVDSDDPWVRYSGVFRRRTLTTGSSVPGAATNNLLLSMAAIEVRGLRFDESLGAIGGEDSLLTHQLTSSGGQILWCDEAEIVSPVPAHRQTRRWITRRLLRAGGSWSQMELRMASGLRGRAVSRASLLTRGLAHGGLAAARALTWRIRGSRVKSIESSARAISYLGLTLGSLGWVYREYHRVR